MSRLHLAPVTTKPRRAPVRAIRPDRAVWKAALRLAKGDRSRLRVLDDGGVLVLRPPA